MTSATLASGKTPSRLGYAIILALIGIGWGSTQPLGKIAASTGHPPFGLIFWQLVVCVLVLGVLTLMRGKRLPLHRAALEFYVVVAFLGTLIPNYTFYVSVARLPSGIMSIIIATIPLIAFPMAMALGMDKFSPRRMLGILLGLSGVLMIVLPQTSLPDPAMLAFLPIAMIGPVFYAMENTYVAARGTAGMDAIEAMLGASIAGLLFCTPVMLATLVIYAGGGLWVSIAAAGLLGLCSGGDNSVSILLARRYFSAETFGRASATQMVAIAAGGGVSPWLAGVVHDRTGSYDLALLMAAACMGGAALAAAWLPEFRPGEAKPGKPVTVEG